jgi:hypothetical protein
MSIFQNAMNTVVKDFVEAITKLAYRAAVDTLHESFGRTPFAGSNPAVGPVSGASVVSATRPAPERSGRQIKRTAADLEALSARFVSFVVANPGLRIEQINRKLGTSTKDLALPIRKLTAGGAIRMVGKKRSTRYFAGKAKSRN